jgi:hypothetical protein
MIKIIRKTKRENGKYKIGDKVRFIGNNYFRDIYEIIYITRTLDGSGLRYWFRRRTSDYWFGEDQETELVECSPQRLQE